MVDFQSRDTRRAPTIDDEAESEGESSADTAEPTEAESETDATSEETAEGTEPASDDPLADETDITNAETPDTEDPLVDDSGQGPPETEEDPLGDPADIADDRSADPARTEMENTESGGETEADGQSAAKAASPAPETPVPNRSIDVAVVTVAGDRASLEDTVTVAFESSGHEVVRRERLRGGYDGIQQMVDTLVGREGVDTVVTVGGVGLAADEMAIEAVHPLLEKALPGFGEAFRSLLAERIGTGIVGVRSTAGVSDGTLVFCLPANAKAAELAVSEILATEAPTLLEQLDA